jgi:hypothetical protein
MSNIVKKSTKKPVSGTGQKTKIAVVAQQAERVASVEGVLRQHIEEHRKLTDELHNLIDCAQRVGEELEKMNDRTHSILRKVSLLKRAK